MTDHRFPLPWIVKEITGGYSVLDACGTSLAHFFVRKGQVEREEARLLALNFCRIPGMLGARPEPGPTGSAEDDLAWWDGGLAPN